MITKMQRASYQDDQGWNKCINSAKGTSYLTGLSRNRTTKHYLSIKEIIP